MPKSLRTPEQRLLQRLLIELRTSAHLTQAQLAAKLERPQSFVAKYEIGERGIDVIEFCAITRALEQEPTAVLARLVETANL
ncbi:multiprotein-bridging factor 1 family protein [uncultured Sphingomonas sp.]|uniref:helix-turn-helix domain-containing protein n=1 Tax=uncultured Sphingomonas sp. TaxID=158754 RepID=UPI0035C9D2E5